MNEDNEYEISAFSPGTGVLMETDDGYELGVVVRIGDAGVLMQSTHRMETVGLVDESGEKKLRAALEGTRTKLLRIFAREGGAGWINSLRMSRDELIEFCLYDAIEEQNKRGARDAMVKLVRPIETWVPMERIKKMVSSTDYAEEGTLRELDFSEEEVKDEKK